jgi:hypothetical protein
MLVYVIKDIGFFLLFFAIVIGAFATAWTVINEEMPTIYRKITKIGYFAMALRRSIGDSDTDSLIMSSEY